jgi:hypothetical protein
MKMGNIASRLPYDETRRNMTKHATGRYWDRRLRSTCRLAIAPCHTEFRSEKDYASLAGVRACWSMPEHEIMTGIGSGWGALPPPFLSLSPLS